MPFRSQAQQRFAFATRQPWAKRFAKETNFKRLPVKAKSMTVEQLETFVSSSHYDADTAALMALGIPALPSLKGEQLAKGITRIHGNLCNVHGKYGPCDKGLAAEGKPAAPAAAASGYSVSKPKPKKAKRGGGKGAGAKKPKAAAKPKQTDDQKKAEADKKKADTAAANAKQEAENITKIGDDTDLGDYLADMNKFSQGKPMRDQDVDALAKEGLMERGADGTPRQTSAGRALMGAAKRGDVQGARDAASRGRDAVAKQGEQESKRQESAGKRATAQAGRELAKRDREAAAAKKREQAKRKPVKASAGPDKTPAKVTPAKPAPRSAGGGGGGGASGGGGGGASAAPKPKPVEKPAKPQVAPALQDAAQLLSDGAEMTPEQVQGLVRNGLAKLDKDGNPVLTSAGLNATKKETSFAVFKDAQGVDRWLTVSSSAFADRDNEIVSEKALSDDCDYADKTGVYGPLRWWHMPGVDIGDCDFNAMHGRTLIESGTFRNPGIAQSAAKAAPDLEISLGFLHLPTEPDPNGVFHHIRRFERSLVPRGKASNLLTHFSVKETPSMLDTKVKEALDKLGSNPDALAYLQQVLDSASSREKALEEQQVAYKADEPVAVEATPVVVEHPDVIVFNGMAYKAFPPPKAEEEAVVETDAIGDAPMDETVVEEEPAAEGGLTLSPEDLSAIRQSIGVDELIAKIDTLAQAMDLVKTMSGHIDKFGTALGGFQATKDTEAAERDIQVATLKATIESTQTKLDELLGLQPATTARPTESAQTVINPWIPQDAQLLESIKNQGSPNDQFAFGDLVQNLFGTQTN